ncbi:MAG: hypothetical protein K0R67_3307 [Paenibacillus sp.]|nr:hypothetical protein [Paenibacillus sp.]
MQITLHIGELFAIFQLLKSNLDIDNPCNFYLSYPICFFI